MAYEFDFDFKATVNPSVTMVEEITVLGRRYSEDNLFTVEERHYSSIDQRDVTTRVQFSDLAAMFAYIEAHRNLLASVAGTKPFPFSVEIAGLNSDGVPTEDFSFEITENKGEKLPYRLQMWRDMEQYRCDTYTDFRSITDAIDEIRWLNALETSKVFRVEEYDNGYRQTFYEPDDTSNGAMYISRMEHKNEEGDYVELPQWRGYHFSPQDIDITVEYTERGIDSNQYVDVANVTVTLDDDTRSVVLQADILFSSGRPPITHTATLYFDELIANLPAEVNATFGDAATLYEELKDDFYYDSQTYWRLTNEFTNTLTAAATDNAVKRWFQLSPLALNEIRANNPSRQTHNAIEEKQKTVEKDRSGGER